MNRAARTVLLALLLAACGAHAQGEALVVFMRSSLLANGSTAALFDVSDPETRFIGIIDNDTKIAHPVKPGTYTFMVVAETADFMQATFAAGHTYYAMVTPRLGVFNARFSFRPVRQHELGGPEFYRWDSATRLETNSAESRNWAAKNAADVGSKRAQYWPEWSAKPEAQRASQSLRTEDGKPTPTLAATPPLTGAARVETVFWESIRTSSQADDFRTYLEQYPNGIHAAAARERLAALTPTPATAPAAALAAPANPLPQRGDAWRYRLTQYQSREGPRQRLYDFTVQAASPSEIIEHYSIDGKRAGEWKHATGAYLVRLGTSVFSPYLGAFQDLAKQPALGEVALGDPMCGGRVICGATARVVGRETVRVPAGTFDTIKVTVDHNWRGWREMTTTAGDGPGRRDLHVWYAPTVKRAVKFSSRLTGARAGASGDFDLELESYEVK